MKFVFDVCILITVLAVAIGVFRYFPAPSPELEIEDGALVIRIKGGDRIWSARRDVRIALVDLVTIGVRQIRDLPTRPGLLDPEYAPGETRLGVYGPKDDPELWLLRNASEVVYIKTREPAQYRQIVLQVSDPRRVIAALRAMVSAAAGQPRR